MERVIIPEYLDALPHDHADALANRRELRLFNWYLGTFSWFYRNLLSGMRGSEKVLEIGAGEGLLIRRLKERIGSMDTDNSTWSALDRSPVFKNDDTDVHFFEGDILNFAGYPDQDIVIGNMILHQFEDEALLQIGEQLTRNARVLVFQEPLRRRFYHGLCWLATRPMGRVTRHDAIVSVQAGFLNEELPERLGLKAAHWDWRIETTLRGAYRMIAWRK